MIDVSFATRSDMKSQTGGTMSLGKGSVFSHSKKQKLNTKSSTEAELVGVDDLTPQIMWTTRFLEAQGYYSMDHTIFQDNQSVIKLETNRVKSSTPHIRALNIRYFFIADLKAKGEVNIVYEPKETMWGDNHTKPLQGAKFLEMHKVVINEK